MNPETREQIWICIEWVFRRTVRIIVGACIIVTVIMLVAPGLAFSLGILVYTKEAFKATYRVITGIILALNSI